MSKNEFIPYQSLNYTVKESINKSTAFFDFMDTRRSVRHFSDQAVPKEIIENIVKTASSAPSGAHKQPWHFCIVSNPSIKHQIRAAAEKEEQENYAGRMSDRWRKDLEKLETDANKEFLEIAPWLIVVMKKAYDIENGKKANNYYVNESVGIASGFLLAAIHNAGLVSLTHTPSPMNFLTKLLCRPSNERPFLLIPVGYPILGAKVPKLSRKTLKEITTYY